VLEAAEDADLELYLVEAVQKALARAIELGHGDDDLAAVIEAVGQPTTARS